MKIAFSAQFENDTARTLGIRKAAASDTVLFAERRESLRGEGMEVQFFMRKIPGGLNGSSLLVYGQTLPAAPDTLTLLRGFRFYDDLCPDPAGKRPTEILAAIAGRFGHEMQIGDWHGTFLADAVVQCERNPDGSTSLVSCPTAKPPCIIEMLVRKSGEMVSVALAYCLDTDRYIDWMRSHGR